MRAIFLICAALVICGCSSMVKRSLAVQQGMSRERVLEVMGTPAGRSFRGDDEAWQYEQLAGFGQCAYVTIWFIRSHVVGITERRGASVAGCGLGSHEVEWSQMPTQSQ